MKMKKVKTIEEGVEAILQDIEIVVNKPWQYLPATSEDLVDWIIFDGKKIPLFWWRYDNQIFPLEEKAEWINSVSCKLNTVTTREHGLERLIFRQCDIAEWFLKSQVKKLNCYQKGGAAEILLTMENKKVAILELAASLSSNTEEQGRLTVWGKQGLASNRVVSQKDLPQSIYVYKDDGSLDTYNDLCPTLYGLSRLDVIKVSAVVDILKGTCDVEEIQAAYERCQKYLEISKKSTAENRPFNVKEI